MHENRDFVVPVNTSIRKIMSHDEVTLNSPITLAVIELRFSEGSIGVSQLWRYPPTKGGYIPNLKKIVFPRYERANFCIFSHT